MDKVAENCLGCTFDHHYCMDSWRNNVTEEMRACELNNKNRNKK
jgi:hypothetical protein